MIEKIYEAAFVPYFREEGKRKQRKLIQQIIHFMDDFMGVNTLRTSLVENSDTHANHSMEGNPTRL